MELSHSEHVVGQQLIPFLSLSVGELPEHAFKGLIKALHHSAIWGVVDRCAQLGDVEEATHLLHDLRHEAGPLVSQDFIGETYPRTAPWRLSSSWLCTMGQPPGIGLHKPPSPAQVPVAVGRLRQGTQDVHANPPEGDPS